MLNIEPIQDEDIQQVVDIYNYYILNSNFTFEVRPHTYASFKQRIDALKGKYPFIIAKEAERVLGYAYLAPFSEREAYSITSDLSLYIDKDHLHEHLGEKLFQEIVRLAKKQKLEAIISIITDCNLNSLSFHKHMGFLEEGHLENVARKFGEDLGVYYYKFDLTK